MVMADVGIAYSGLFLHYYRIDMAYGLVRTASDNTYPIGNTFLIGLTAHLFDILLATL